MTSIVNCHSPSHLIAVWSSRSGWVALYRAIDTPFTRMASNLLLIASIAYTGDSIAPATSPVT